MNRPEGLDLKSESILVSAMHAPTPGLEFDPLNIGQCFIFFSFEANHAPSGKKNGDLNAGGLNASGQMSLSCHKEVIKLTHCVHIMCKTRTKKEQETGDWCNPAPDKKHSHCSM